MKNFMDKDFLLQSETACRLYHDYVEGLPIIDYHCHLSPQEIAEDKQFRNLTEIWLGGDHYKWRALRANGVNERYITGKDTSDWEKFEKWAETIPYTMRNPLYHWTHLELQTAFGIRDLLKPSSASAIYEKCNALLQTKAYSARNLMRRYRVEVVCTTDDPTDSLAYHKQLKEEGFEIKVLPTWRPDKAIAVENPKDFIVYLKQLSEVAATSIQSYADFIKALRKRHDFFHEMGCRLSDHGLSYFYAEDYTPDEIDAIFTKVSVGQSLSSTEIAKFKSAILYEGGLMDYEKGWTQQFHFGPLRNNNSKMYQELGPDTGYDSMGDWSTAASMSRFLDKLASQDKLAKTILYNINPKDNDMVATMVANFQDGTIPGKIQFGSGWWFLDQKQGIESQLNALSNHGLLSRFVGMLTDSRSFLSYPRHEYFRRVLCNVVGQDIEEGLLPNTELEFIGQMLQNICYYNAKNFFGF